MITISRNQRGIAMMVVLFSLLLLSVVGLGMMYSTNMETSINGNYRDKQDASYAALAGLQEARERIRISSYDVSGNPVYSVHPPFLLPSTAASANCPTNAGVAAGCIIYIVSDASKVKPWDSTNAYYDTELCQEQVLGLTGTAGVPCSGPPPSGSAWYQVYDDHLSSATPWNLTNPLDWKWTRIQLKANNNTPVAVNGNSANSDQTCWNGTNQMSTPYGASTGCRPTGGVSAIIVVTSGGGYTSAGPTVTIGGDGTGATVGTLDMQPETTGYISSITVTTGGSGYTSSPTATITGTGTGATAYVILSSSGTTTTTAGSVTTVSLTTGGAGYTTAPTVDLSGGGGSGATATATLSTTGTTTATGYVNTITLTNGGSGYTSAPTVNFSGGSGSGASATASLGTSGKVVSVDVSSVGTQCYSSAADVVVTFSGGSGSGATATGVLETGRSCIYSVAVPSTNCNNQLKVSNGYSPADQKSGVTLRTVGNYSFSGTLFVQAANDKTPTSLTVQNPGYDAAGYSSPSFTSTLELYNGGSGYTAWSSHGGNEDCNNITVTATTGYRLASLTLTNGGSGYMSTPTVTVSGGIGSTSSPTATATLGYPISSLTLTGGGSSYASAPTISFTGGGGGCGVCTAATATDTVITSSTTTYPVAYVTVTSGGIGYTSTPTVSFSGGSGSGAAATAAVSAATVTTYPVLSVSVSTGGTGYTSATVSFSGGGGSGAAATAAISTTTTGTYYVNAIPIASAGSGYTYDPPITISGGGGTGATAVSQISGGTKYGNVWLLTSVAQTNTGARSMVQTEVGSPVLGYSPGGALTLDGPSPVLGSMPNSTNFVVAGADANTCGETPDSKHPAIDGYDDPNNPTTPSAVSTILSALPRPDHYTGSGPTPSVQNGYEALGPTMTTPTGLNQLITNITNTALTIGAANGGHVYTGTPANVTDADIALGSCPTGNMHDASCHTVIDVVQGNLTLTGNPTGYGILLVEGTLNMGGNFSWYGPVFVVGDGIAHINGGGSGQMLGNLFIGKIWNGDAVHYPNTNLLGTHDLGIPTISWVGGGNNGIQFDHCWTTNLMNAVQGTYTTTDAYKILSQRMLSY